MSNTTRDLVHEYRDRVAADRRILKAAVLLLGLGGVSAGLWMRARFFDSVVALAQGPLDGSALGATIAASADVALAHACVLLGFGFVALWAVLVLKRDRKNDLLLALFDELVSARPQPTISQSASSRMPLRRFLGISILAGLFLSVLMATLDAIGGVEGSAIARIIGFPALLWSDTADAIGFHSLVNQLFADPGCFGRFSSSSNQARLLSHYVSSLPPFTMLVLFAMAAYAAIQRRRARNKQSGF